MTSTDGGGYHKSGSAERCSPPPINTRHRYLHVEIIAALPRATRNLVPKLPSQLLLLLGLDGKWSGPGASVRFNFLQLD